MMNATSLGSSRRLHPTSFHSRCGGHVASTWLQTTLLEAEIHFSLFDEAAKENLWLPKPLVGKPHRGAIRVQSCSLEDLSALRDDYAQLAYGPLLQSLRAHNNRKPLAPAVDGVALVVLPDYTNLFHQFGSVAMAWAALQESYRALPDPKNDGGGAGASPPDASRISIFMLSNASLSSTALLWSPGLAARPPTFVRGSPPPPPATYSRVVLAQPTTETWWWNVWAPDETDRRPTLRPLIARLSAALLLLPPGRPPPLAAQQHRAVSIALLLRRSPPSDRRILNDVELLAALSPTLLASAPSPDSSKGSGSGGSLPPLRARLIDLSTLDMRAQLAMVQSAGLLVGAHGAGLVWNLFLPPGAPVVELLNRANMNNYYANHCRWSRRQYRFWQNGNASAEESAGTDPLTGEPLAPFRNHMRVDVPQVVAKITDVLKEQQTTTFIAPPA